MPPSPTESGARVLAITLDRSPFAAAKSCPMPIVNPVLKSAGIREALTAGAGKRAASTANSAVRSKKVRQ